MKINDIIECINQTLDIRRNTLKIKSKAFFTIRKAIERKMGPIKVFHTYIEFQNEGKTYPVYKSSNIERVIEGQESDIWNRIDKETVKALMNIMLYGVGIYSWDKFVTGEYHGIE